MFGILGKASEVEQLVPMLKEFIIQLGKENLNLTNNGRST